VGRVWFGGHIGYFLGMTWLSIFKVCFVVFSEQEATKALMEDLENVRRMMETLKLQTEDYDRYDLLISPFFFFILLQPYLSPVSTGRGKH
jgi:hypothetical protein